MEDFYCLPKQVWFDPDEVKPFIDEALRWRTIENLTANAASPSATVRRIYEIREGRSHKVSLAVVDEVLTCMGRPDVLQLLIPL